MGSPVDDLAKMAIDPAHAAGLPGEGGRAVPPGYPDWAREFADQYYSGTSCLFLLHGNVHDLVWLGEDAGGSGRVEEGSFGSLPQFLATRMFGTWDVVLRYDLGQGLRPYAGHDADRLRSMRSILDPKLGDPKSWPRDPDAALDLIDRLVQQILMAAGPAR